MNTHPAIVELTKLLAEFAVEDYLSEIDDDGQQPKPKESDERVKIDQTIKGGE
jgi:hypothetical protein